MSYHDDHPLDCWFDRLPIELQVEVFENCLDPYPRFNAQAAPLLICSVTSSWREIVRNTPNLWSRFEISIVESSSTYNQNRLNVLGLWLERSGNNLLSIQISHTPTGHLPDPRLAQVLAALGPHAGRLGDIRFQTQSSSIALLQHFLSEYPPGLQTMSIDLKGLWRSSFDIRETGISWGQLRELDLSFDYEQLPNLDCYLDILANCTNLQRCSLNADCVFSRNFTQKVALHRLHHFGITLQSGPQMNMDGLKYGAGSSLVTFLEQLELPYLSSLSLRWLVGVNHNHSDTLLWSAKDQSRFISILGSLAPALSSLSLAYLPFSDTDLLDCLRQTQRLSDLDLRFSLADQEGDPITDMLLNALTLSIDSSTYLPFLRTCHIQCHGARCTALKVLNLIQSRSQFTSREAGEAGEAYLRSFGLVSLIPISTPQTKNMLKKWSQEGLKVTLEKLLVH